LENSDCVFCSTQESITGRTHLYLVFNDEGQVYSRNGLKGTWDKVNNEDECNSVKEGLDHAIRESNIPRFSA
jgi:hypothetical protein